MNSKIVAIIGPTASGKSALSIEVAKKFHAVILSLDSLSVYKQIDIASAKPTLSQRRDVVHFGIDLIFPNQHFSAAKFVKHYFKAYNYAKKANVPLIIVGGSSFYLKSLLDGFSPTPKIAPKTTDRVLDILEDTSQAYKLLLKIDPIQSKRIARNDRYRIQKLLEIYLAADMPPSLYFKKNPPKPIIDSNIAIFELQTQKDQLLCNIESRTVQMISSGLIDEVAYLESTYTRSPPAMGAIGIKETLSYLDGRLSKAQLLERISINTHKLAKKQIKFNKTQFEKTIKIQKNDAIEKIGAHL